MAEWENLRILGMGSYGVVYLAVLVAPREANGKLIAVKSSRPNLAYSLKKEEIILKSFRGCKEILHCIGSQVTVKNGHLIYNLLLEFAPYGSLGDLIKKKQLWESEVSVYTRMLLKGLSRIHQNGIVHCDLKPDNILLFPSSEDGAWYQLKIADFGLSKTRDEEFNADAWKMKFRGTPLYMSPESLIMGQIDTPLDIWSLGCIVIEMITGLPAWGNLHTKEDIMFKLGFLREAPKIPNGLSKDCKDFLSKCFMKNPGERWTANKLLNHPFLFPTYDIFRGYKGFDMTSTSFFSFEFDCAWRC